MTIAAITDDLRIERGELTTGQWEDEESACVAIDGYVAQSFRIYREVKGQYLLPKLGVDGSPTPRIDRILIPKTETVRSGWTLGPIGVECKRSGVKTGRAYSQLLDYRHAIWDLKEPRLHLAIEWLFLWPAKRAKGPLESILTQNRIGWASPTWARDGVTFQAGPRHIAVLTTYGATIRTMPDSGRHMGSR